MNLQLLDRSARSVALTANGEQLLGYAKRMLALNDEALARLTHQEYEGEIVLGVPSDIVYPAIPTVLSRFHAEYPRVKVQLISSYTTRLKDMFRSGKCDVILTTESGCDTGGEILAEKPLIWIGAPGGSAWRQRPIRLAFEYNCIFRKSVQSALDKADIAWEMAVESNSSRTIEASVSADLAVHSVIDGTEPPYVERIQHGGALPELTSTKINLYQSEVGGLPVVGDLAELVRHSYRAL